MEASVHNLRCTSCGGEDFKILGTKGAKGRAVGSTLMFGAIGAMVAGSNAETNGITEPMEYKCNSCKKKFLSGPLQAVQEELLAAPCVINFQRVSKFTGSLVPQIVYLNGIKIGPVKNGQTITFYTNIRYNTIFATDQFGVAFKDIYKFEAVAGGNILVRFNRKFMQ